MDDQRPNRFLVGDEFPCHPIALIHWPEDLPFINWGLGSNGTESTVKESILGCCSSRNTVTGMDSKNADRTVRGVFPFS